MFFAKMYCSVMGIKLVNRLPFRTSINTAAHRHEYRHRKQIQSTQDEDWDTQED